MVTFTLDAPSNDNPRRTQDRVIPFLLNLSQIRGRITKLGPVLDAIISSHKYPAAVSHLLGEALVVAALLGTMLKRKGLITIQATGNGPVKFIVVDCTHDGKLRGYANIAKDADMKKLKPGVPLSALLGTGYLAITMDYAGEEERYQGIVPLDHATLTECLREYFHKSEQINTILKLIVGRRKTGKKYAWYGGGILAQHLPEAGGKSQRAQNFHTEKWENADAFIESVRESELLDPDLSSDTLLYRLFHQDGVWVYDPVPLSKECRCSRRKIENFLKPMREDDIEEMMVKGSIKVTCEFCGTTEKFTRKELDILRKG